MNGETELRQRGELLDELAQIVQSMRNLAFAELQRVSRGRQVRESARQAVEAGLAALEGDPSGADRPGAGCSGRPSSEARVVLVIGAERGFCGGFNSRLVQACVERGELDSQGSEGDADEQERPSPVTFLASSRRLADLLTPHGAAAEALPGCASSDESEAVLSAWLERLAKALASGQTIEVMHIAGQDVQTVPLWPMVRPDAPVMVTSPVRYWLDRSAIRLPLQLQWLELRLRELMLDSLEQENHWRLAQMQRAQDRLEELRRDLHRRYAMVRQSNITTELETLASSGQDDHGHT